jgi:hypothetical protein
MFWIEWWREAAALTADHCAQALDSASDPTVRFLNINKTVTALKAGNMTLMHIGRCRWLIFMRIPRGSCLTRPPPPSPRT